MLDDKTETAAVAEALAVPWYRRKLRCELRVSSFTRWFLVITLPIILLQLVSVKPLWQLGWRLHLYGSANFVPMRSSTGRLVWGSRWARSREIRVYGAPDVAPECVEVSARELQRLVRELGLNIRVRRVTAPPEALRSLRAATIARDGERAFDFDAFIARRLDDRGTQYGEMVVVDDRFANPGWAFGLTHFPAGVTVVRSARIGSGNLARHEGVHLLGYDRHDDMPWYVLGYREHWIPEARDTLMMLMPRPNEALSPRARDALRNFWRGMEWYGHTRYLAEPR